MERLGEHAVVVGASMAGLLAARVLSEAYDQVTVLERDAHGPIGESRKGVPQGRHPHVLLRRGEEVLEELFPGFLHQLTRAGAFTCDLLAEARFAPSGPFLVKASTGLRMLQASRPFLEGHVRRLVEQLPNVDLLDQCEVLGPTMDGPRRRVTGVRFSLRTGVEAGEKLDADVVVDASGRTGRAAAWLEALGYPRPPEDTLHIGVGYSTCVLHLDPAALGGDKFVVAGAEPGRPFGIALLAVEEGRWLLTLYGYEGHRPPADPDAFWAFAEMAAPADVYEAIRNRHMTSPIVTHRFESNLRRRYERVRRLPVGLLAIGDALCSFNPIYGQGMTVAARQALALRRCLARGDRHLPRRFFRAAAKVVDPAWKMATGADLALPEIEGRRTVEVRAVNAYMRRVFLAASHDPTVATAFMRVAGMVDAPQKLLRPALTLRVLRGSRAGHASDPAPLGAARPVPSTGPRLDTGPR